VPAGTNVARPGSATGSKEAAELADLEMQRSRLLSDLERLRAAHTREEADFRARRREVTIELHERRRISNELATAEPQLRERVAALRTGVEHLERRQPELSAEIDASKRSSNVLRERVVIARRELEELHKDRERVGTRLETELQRLRDLTCRRELLLAETEELAMLARRLQGVDGRTHLLSQVTDGEMRDRTHLRRLRGASKANSRADVTERTITLRSDDPLTRLRARLAPQPDDTRAQAVWTDS
jgi:chromosome segregation ATPase